MKTLTTTLATAALCLLTGFASAQGTQYIKIPVTENSNMPTQTPATMVIMLDATGDDLLNFPDAGNEGSLGQYNDQVFPFTHSSDGFVITNLDARPTLTSYRTIPVGFVCKNAGDIKVIADISSDDVSTPLPGFVWLEQLSTGERYSILDTTKFSIPGNPGFLCDFVLHIGPDTYTSSTDETCFGAANGSLFVSSPNYPGFTHELYHNSSLIFTGVIAGADTTFTNVAAGNYVSVIRINGIAVDSMDVTVNAATPLIADFWADYNVITEGGSVNFTDNSTGALNYTWDFGDGDSSLLAGNATHQYNVSGSYTVTLTVEDGNGCVASNFDIIQVDPQTTSINNPFNPANGHGSFSGVGAGPFSSPTGVQHFRNTTSTFYNNQKIVVDLGEAKALKVTITTMNGQVISAEAQNDVRAEYSIPANGLYLVTIEYTDGTASSSTVLAQ